MAESISEGTLKTWLKQPGDRVEADEEVATIETDKVCLTRTSSASTYRSACQTHGIRALFVHGAVCAAYTYIGT